MLPVGPAVNRNKGAIEGFSWAIPVSSITAMANPISTQVLIEFFIHPPVNFVADWKCEGG
jgi:hypothetical protein